MLEYEIPAFLADMASTRVNSTPPAPLYPTGSLTGNTAVYALWIGTNDLGIWAFLTDSQVPGKVLADYTACIYDVLDALYGAGGRHFVLMNTVPLELAPLYANDTLHGVGDNQYWPHKWANHTQVAEAMREATTSVNAILQFQTPLNCSSPTATRAPIWPSSTPTPCSRISTTTRNSISTARASRPAARVSGAMRTTVPSISRRRRRRALSCRMARIQMLFSGMTSCIRGTLIVSPY